MQYVSAKQPDSLGAGMVASLYLIRQRGEGHILDDTGLFGANGISNVQAVYLLPGTPEFFSYLTRFLESPERSGPSFFDQQRYMTATKECLQLYLCSHLKFSKGATESGPRDKDLRRSKPSAWIARLGAHRRIRKGRHRLKARQRKSLKVKIYISQYASFPKASPNHDYYRFLSYRWALDLLPFLLDKSSISLELAELLYGYTFTTMARGFPRRMRLAKEAIMKYLLRVEAGVGDSDP